MTHGWHSNSVGECVAPFVYRTKIQRRDFLSAGRFPIVSQEAGLINGYWNEETAVARVDRPVVVFGDHTRVLKFVDFDFVVGADGVKVLRPREFLDPKFFYYQLEAMDLGSLGYARHFRLLRERTIRFPTIPEQRRIVKILDEVFAGIAEAKARAEQNRQNARALFEAELASAVMRDGAGSVESTIGEVARFIDYRGKTPRKTAKGLRLITAKNVKFGYVQEAPMEFVAPDSYDSWMTRGIPQRGDVLFTTEAPLANVAQLDTDEKVVFAQRIIVMQPDRRRLDSTFLKFLLLSRPIQKRIHDRGTGATVKGIKASVLKNVPISFPDSVSEQRRVTAKLTQLSTDVARLENAYHRKLAALDELKASLLHQAFSGQL